MHSNVEKYPFNTEGRELKNELRAAESPARARHGLCCTMEQNCLVPENNLCRLVLQNRKEPAQILREERAPGEMIIFCKT